MASPHPFFGAKARVVLASAVFSLVQFVVGDIEWFCFFRLLGGERGAWECRLLSGLPSFSEASGEGAYRASVVDVLVIIQLKFLQYFENVEVPQIPSSTECSRFQLCYRGEHAQCKLCTSRRFHSAVL